MKFKELKINDTVVIKSKELDNNTLRFYITNIYVTAKVAQIMSHGCHLDYINPFDGKLITNLYLADEIEKYSK